MMNSRQVEQLFAEECVLINDSDVIPLSIAIDIFGKDAVDFARSCNGLNFNVYSIAGDDADEDVIYLTFRGVQLAATYNNIREIQKMEKMNLKDVEWHKAHKIIDFVERRRQA